MDEDELYEALVGSPQEQEGEAPPQDVEERSDGMEQLPEGERGEEAQTTSASPEQPHDTSAWQEEARRRAEAVDKAYADAYEGTLNPYTGQPIRSKADHDALKQQMGQEHQQQVHERLRALGLEPGDIAALISGHPAIQQAERLVAEAQARQEEQQREQAKEWYAGELREIAALDPTVTDLETLKAKDAEQFSAMLGLVSKGIGLAQAYKLVNFETLMRRQGAASAQQERNRTAGKAHLLPTKGVGAGVDVEVPEDVRQMYREMNPGMTDAEIRREYADYLKDTK